MAVGIRDVIPPGEMKDPIAPGRPDAPEANRYFRSSDSAFGRSGTSN